MADIDEKELEKKLKDELFNRLVVGKDRKKKKAAENPFDSMRKMMEDPFNTKGWAKGKAQEADARAKKKDRRLIDMVLVEASEKDVDKLRDQGKFGYYE